MTGTPWIDEGGMLTTPIALTNSLSVGVVRDALAGLVNEGGERQGWWLPVVGETWDGTLNDITGQHVTAAHVRQAYETASDGPVAEGNVGGGTGMICHGFKGGTGTASRTVPDGWTVGVLVQANHGQRSRFSVGGVPVGQMIDGVPEPGPLPDPPNPAAAAGAGSIIGIIATDAPLLPHQCRRLAQRAALGVARAGGAGENLSGDGFFAFSTAHRGRLPADGPDAAPPRVFTVDVLADAYINDLFYGVIDATEEAILNALLAAETMTGRDSVTAHALPHDALRDAVRAFRVSQ